MRQGKPPGKIFDDPGRLEVVAFGIGWLVVCKPAGVSVHNDPGGDLISRASAWLAHNPGVAPRLSSGAGFGLAAVHRLDRDTSGVLMLACRADAFRCLSGQFERREVEKRYIAVLHGRLAAPGGSGTWDAPLAQKAGGRNHPQGNGRKSACRTDWQILDQSRRYTLAAVSPLTGRKHQIRRHAKLAGHPVVGDRRYGSHRSLRYLKERCGFDRLALHAESLTVRLPDRSGPETFTSPAPTAFEDLMAEDR